MATPTYVNSTTTYSATNTATTVTTASYTPTVGNVLFVSVNGDSAGSSTTSLTYTLVDSLSSSNFTNLGGIQDLDHTGTPAVWRRGVNVWICPVTVGTARTFTGTVNMAHGVAVTIIEYSGIGTALGGATKSYTADGGLNADSAMSFTTSATGTNELVLQFLIGSHTDQASIQADAVPNSPTTRVSSSDSAITDFLIRVGEKQAPAASTAYGIGYNGQGSGAALGFLVQAPSITVPYSAGFNFTPSNTASTLSLGTQTAGDTLIVFVDYASATSGNDISTVQLTDSGHTNAALTLDYHPPQFTTGSAHYDRIGVWRFSNISGGTTSIAITANASIQSWADAVVFAVRGLDYTSPYDSAVSANATNLASNTLTITGSSALSVTTEIALSYAVDSRNDNGATTASSGWTTTDPNAAATSLGDGYGSSHQIYTSVATPSLSYSFSGGTGTADPNGVIVAYKASGGTAPQNLTRPIPTEVLNFVDTLSYTYRSSRFVAFLREILGNVTTSPTKFPFSMPGSFGGQQTSTPYLSDTTARTSVVARSTSDTFSLLDLLTGTKSSLKIVNRGSQYSWGSGGTTITWAQSFSVAVNDTLILFFEGEPSGGTTTVTVSDGTNTWTRDAFMGSSFVQTELGVFHYTATSSMSSFTITLTLTSACPNYDLALFQVTGLDTTSPFDFCEFHQPGSASTDTYTTTASTKSANELAFTWFGSPGPNTLAVSSPWTLEQNQNGVNSDGFGVARQTLSSIGKPTVTWTNSGAKYGAVAVATYVISSSNAQNLVAALTEVLSLVGITANRIFVGSRSSSESTSVADSIVRLFSSSRLVSELTSSVDSLVQYQILVRLIQMSLSATDTPTRLFIGNRNLVDSLNISDTNLVRLVTLSRLQNEALSALDSLTRVASNLRTQGESEAILDSIQRSYAGARTQAELLSLVDTINQAIVAGRTTAEVLITLDSIQRSLTSQKNISEITMTLDTFKQSLLESRVPAEIITSIDSIQRSLVNNRSLSNILAEVDSLQRALVQARVNNEILASFDTIQRSLIQKASFIELTSLLDSLQRSIVQGRTANEILLDIDSIQRTLIQNRLAAEITITVDLIQRFESSIRNQIESQPLLDGIVRIFSGARSLGEITSTSGLVGTGRRISVIISETAVAIDAIARSFTGARSTSESSLIQDVLSRTTFTNKSIADALSTIDTINKVQQLGRISVEGNTTQDSINRAVINNRINVESLSLIDVIAVSLKLTRLLNENPTVADSVARMEIALRLNNEAVSTVDQLNRVFVGARVLSAEILNISAQLTAVQTKIAYFSESPVTNDTIKSLQSLGRSAAEIQAMLDSINRIEMLARSSTEIESLTDTSSRAIIATRNFLESVYGGVTLSDYQIAARTYQEQLGLIDSTSRVGLLNRKPQDILGLSDTILRSVISSETMAETVSTIQTITRLFVGTRLMSDSTATLDSIVRSAGYVKALSLVLLTNDSINRFVQSFRTMGESTSLIDQTFKSGSTAVTIGEILVTNALASRFANQFRTTSDVVLQNPTISVARSFLRSVVDSTFVQDNINRVENLSRAFVESPVVSDTIGRVENLGRAFNEATPVADTFKYGQILTRALSDNPVTGDIFKTVGSYSRSSSETLLGVFATNRIVNSARQITESTSVIDVMFKAGTTAFLIGEAIVESDTIARRLVEARATSQEIVPVVDTLSKAFARFATVTESTIGADNISRFVRSYRILSDGQLLIDSLTRASSTNAVFGEVTVVVDTIFRAGQNLTRFISESVPGGDTLVRSIKANQIIIFVSSVGDATNRTINQGRSNIDILTTLNVLSNNLALTRTEIESALTNAIESTMVQYSRNNTVITSVQDTISSYRSLTATFNLVLAVADSVGRNMSLGRLNNEVVTVIDSVGRSVSMSRAIATEITTIIDTALAVLSKLVVPKTRIFITFEPNVLEDIVLSQPTNINMMFTPKSLIDITPGPVANISISPSKITNIDIEFGAV